MEEDGHTLNQLGLQILKQTFGLPVLRTLLTAEVQVIVKTVIKKHQTQAVMYQILQYWLNVSEYTIIIN
jgi:hypothetical protein